MTANSSAPLREKSYTFAVDVVQTCRSIINDQKEYILSKQLLRSGSSIGANIEESQYAQSKADFVSKLSIALKEASETRYWIRLLTDSHYIHDEKKISMIQRLNEIIAMLVSSINTAKASME